MTTTEEICIRVRTSREACQLTTKDERRALIKRALETAVQVKSRFPDSVIVNAPNDLKLIIDWHAKTIHLITKMEAGREMPVNQ